MISPTPPPPKKLPADVQQRLHALLDKNSEGAIAAEERAELKTLVEASEILMMANMRLIAEFSKKTAGTPTGAVPVTVWVKPEHAESYFVANAEAFRELVVARAGGACEYCRSKLD